MGSQQILVFSLRVVVGAESGGVSQRGREKEGEGGPARCARVGVHRAFPTRRNAMRQSGAGGSGTDANLVKRGFRRFLPLLVLPVVCRGGPPLAPYYYPVTG